MAGRPNLEHGEARTSQREVSCVRCLPSYVWSPGTKSRGGICARVAVGGDTTDFRCPCLLPSPLDFRFSRGEFRARHVALRGVAPAVHRPGRLYWPRLLYGRSVAFRYRRVCRRSQLLGISSPTMHMCIPFNQRVFSTTFHITFSRLSMTHVPLNRLCII